jgi:hypothetical protein
MHPSLMPIDAELLRRLYVDERLTARDIASRLHCTETMVLRRLRSFGIVLRKRGPAPRHATEPRSLGWSPAIAYAVGVIATDGNLGRDERHLTVTSKDFELLNTIRVILGIGPAVASYRSGSKRLRCSRLQWSDGRQHAWLRSLGLTPAKSRTLGPLAVPDQYFADFLRGCIDGDGSIVVYTDRYHTAKNPSYVYQRLYVTLVSGSQAFPKWLQMTIQKLTGMKGSINQQRKRGYEPLYILRYAKRESIQLLHWLYHSPDVPCLPRKRARAQPFISGPFRGMLPGQRAGVE